MRVVFMGTPAFAVPSLEVLVRSGYCPAAVVTGEDKARGRGRKVSLTAVKRAAGRLGIRSVLQPPSVRTPAFAEAIQTLQPDIIVVVAFRILPRAAFAPARVGAFNLHASLLPRYRGAAPIQRALMAGETKTGVTTFFLEKRVDTGNIILRWPTQVGPTETAGMLHDRLALLGARAVLETVRRLEDGRATARPQDGTQATPAPKIQRNDCAVPWEQPAQVVHNHCRGLSPIPGAWTHYSGRRLKILSTRCVTGQGPPGSVLSSDTRLVIACGSGAVEVLRLQQAGHRAMEAAAFLRGFPMRPGTRLHADHGTTCKG